MLAYFLVLLLHSLACVSSLLCNSGTLNELIPVVNEFSTCNGTACFIAAYAFRYPQYQGLFAFEMGCLTAPYQLPLGCRKDENGDVLCLCGDDYCNDQEILSNSSSVVAVATCPWDDATYYGADLIGECRAALCLSQYTSYMSSRTCNSPYDGDQFEILASFDLFYFGYRGYVWPAQSCIRMDSEYLYQGEAEYCLYTYPYVLPNKTMNKLRKQTICRYSPSDVTTTCVGHFCWVGENAEGKVAMGCLQQTNPEGLKLVPGFFDFHRSKLFICNTTMCNGDHDPYGNKKENWVVVPEDTGPIYWDDGNPINESCCPRGEQKKKTTSRYSLILAISFLVFVILA